MRPALLRGAIVGIQAGNAYIKEPFVRHVRYELTRLFKHVDYFYAPIPSFPSGGIGFLFASASTPISGPIDTFRVETSFLNTNTFEAGFKIAPPSLYVNKRRDWINWHRVEEFDWLTVMNPKEIDCMNALADLDDESGDIDRQFPLFSITQGYMDHKECGNCSLEMFTIENVDKIQPYFWAMMESRGDKLPVDVKINGVTWNTLGSPEWGRIVQYHSILPLAEIEKLYPDLYAKKPEICYDEAVLTFMFLGGGLTGVRVTYSDLSRDYIASRSEGVVTKLVETTMRHEYTVDRVRTNASQWAAKVNEGGQKDIDKFTKRGMMLRRVSYLHRDSYSMTFEAP